MSTEAIPVELISGFLGAGKTSYLNQLIRHGMPADSVLLINDFGAINIDAELVEYRDERVIRLTNGCMCCSLAGGVAEQIHATLTLPVRPAALFIEMSGVGRPRSVVDVITLASAFRLSEVTCLVDASAVARHQSNAQVSDIWFEQIRSATRLLLNRGADAEARAALEAELRALAPQASLSWMPGLAVTAERAPALGAGSLVSRTLKLPAACSRDWLQGVFARHAAGLLRAKGMLWIDDGAGPYCGVLQFSGGRLSISRAARGSYVGSLVCIGLQSAAFDACLAELEAA